MTWLVLLLGAGLALYRSLAWIRITPMSDAWLDQENQRPEVEYHGPIQQWPIRKAENECAWRNTLTLRKRA